MGVDVAEQLRSLGHALVVVEGAGHGLPTEAPQQLLRVLRDAAAAVSRPVCMDA
jgi:pimeloyl-ACP methyl ester carboxylesterase